LYLSQKTVATRDANSIFVLLKKLLKIAAGGAKRHERLKMCKATGRIESNVKFSKRVAMEAAPGKDVRKKK
jgi:hypothetical protein